MLFSKKQTHAQMFNGYTNYETWDIALYWDNEQDMYHRQNTITETVYNLYCTNEDRLYQLMSAIKRYSIAYYHNRFDVQLKRAHGTINNVSNIKRVNWLEIAESWMIEYELQNKHLTA